MDGYSAHMGFGRDLPGVGLTMSRWTWIPVVFGLTVASSAGAQQAPVAPPFAFPDAQSHRGVVDDTWIVAPKRLPGATLAAVKNYADEGDIAAGVSLRYHLDNADWIIADVFIYPAGEGDPSTMLKQATEDFRESVAYAERQQIYRNVWRGDEAPYVASLGGGRKLEGRFLPIVFDAQQDMLTSRAYLFYRRLYFVKIRLSTTVEAVDSLAERADRFIGSLLGAVDIVSVGGCGRKMEIVALSPGQDAPADLIGGVSADGFRIGVKVSKAGAAGYGAQMSKAMALATRRQLASGCTSLDYTPPGDDATHAVLHLSFGPNDWGAGPRSH